MVVMHTFAKQILNCLLWLCKCSTERGLHWDRMGKRIAHNRRKALASHSKKISHARSLWRKCIALLLDSSRLFRITCEYFTGWLEFRKIIKLRTCGITRYSTDEAEHQGKKCSFAGAWDVLSLGQAMMLTPNQTRNNCTHRISWQYELEHVRNNKLCSVGLVRMALVLVERLSCPLATYYYDCNYDCYCCYSHT